MRLVKEDMTRKLHMVFCDAFCGGSSLSFRDQASLRSGNKFHVYRLQLCLNIMTPRSADPFVSLNVNGSYQD